MNPDHWAFKELRDNRRRQINLENRVALLNRRLHATATLLVIGILAAVALALVV